MGRNEQDVKRAGKAPDAILGPENGLVGAVVSAAAGCVDEKGLTAELVAHLVDARRGNPGFDAGREARNWIAARLPGGRNYALRRSVLRRVGMVFSEVGDAA